MMRHFNTDIGEYRKDVKMRRAIAAARVCFLLSALTATMLWISGCDKKPHDTTPEAEKTDKKKAVSDMPLATFQLELLELAFDTATAIPVYPHIKDRSRAQEAVAAACLKLDQPNRAFGYIERIDNWRRGAGYADLALYYAQHGLREKAQMCLDMANQVANKGNQNDANENVSQQWRTDLIKVKIAQTQVLLGNIERAMVYEANMVESQTGKVAAVVAMAGEPNSFDEQVKTLEELIARGNFDITRNTLDAYAQLFSRFYADTNRRSMIEDKMKVSYGKMPVYIRIDFLGKLAGFAIMRNDAKKAIELINEAQSLVDGYTWPLEYQIPTAAKLTGLRFRAGDKEKAKSDANVLLALYDANSAVIVNIYRAGALRPLAEAYQMMGDRETALSVYKKAVKEGIENPNSRPRAEDLSATCCSLALYAVEPDSELWSQMHQIRKGLGEPW
jgi:tetratricopeptide (TPR) repeat protein